VTTTSNPPVKEGILGTAYFDARFFTVPTVEEALNCVLWRCRSGVVRNNVGAFARTLYTTKALHLKNTHQILEIMKVEKGVVFEEAVPNWAVERSMVTKERSQYEGKSPKTGKVELTARTRMTIVDRGIGEFSEENLRLITDKFWP
jgi:tRNA(His) guanylyltransferase